MFAGDTFQDNQRVTISEPATGSQLAQFTQLHNANQLIVNRAPGSSGQTLNSYAELVKADSTGRLLVRVDSSGGFFFGLAGIAIEESQPPTPDVLIGNATVDESAGTASFPVTLTSAANDDITLTLTTASGTALAGQDFTATTAQVTILTGQTTATATFDVPIIDDVDAELDEMFTVSVQSVDAGTVANTADTGTGTIRSSDLALTVVINDATVSEGAGLAATSATVTRNLVTANALTVTLLSNDTSEATVVGTVTIPANMASATFDINAVEDTIVDGTQTVTITASATDHANGTDTLDVTDNDTPGLSVVIAAAEISESAGPAATTATVSRNTDTTNVLTVNLTSDDTSEATVIASIDIPAGQTSVSFDIDAVPDTIVDGTQTVTITASAAGHSIGSATLDVTDDDTPALSLTIAAASVLESDGLAATTATVTRNTDTTLPLDVTLTSSDDTEAKVPLTVTIPAGQASFTFDIEAVDDAVVDGDQNVTITAVATGHADGTGSLNVLDDDARLTVTLGKNVITEADGSGATTITVTRNTDTTNALPVTITSSDTTEALINGAASRTIDIPAGQASVTIDLDAVDDAIQDGPQDVTISASATGLLGHSDVVTVIDDETPLVTLSIDNTSIAEAGGIADIVANVSFPATSDILITLATGGSATSTGPDADYTLSGTTLRIPAGQLSSLSGATAERSVRITANSDVIDEIDETIVVTVGSLTNAQVNPGFQNVTTTILDDDDPPVVSITPENNAVVEGELVVYTLELSAASSLPVVVDLALGGTAERNGVDYDEPTPSLQITIPAGSMQATVSMQTIDDTLSEGVETIVLGIVGVSNATAGTPSQQTVLINDNDNLPVLTFSVDESSIPEDFGQAIFTATLSEATGQAVVIDLDRLGTATEGVDYTISKTQLTIPAGQLSASTIVATVQDNLDEPDETVLLRVSNVANARVIGTAEAQTLIVDGDIAPTVTLSSSVASITEDGGTFQFFATLNTESGKDVTVNLLLTGDAVDGQDYTRLPASADQNIQVVIPAGQLSVPIDVTVNDDSTDEFTELVVIEFVSVVNAVENIVQQASTEIIDNDDPVTVDLSVDTNNIVESSGGTVTVTATLSAPSGKPVSVVLAHSGDATFTTDYTLAPLTITIPAGDTTGTAVITPVDDALSEGDESVVVDIQSVTNADENGVQQQTVTIVDDEGLPSVSLSVDATVIAEAGGSAVFTATLSEVSGRPVTVDLSIAGQATAGVDYLDPGTQIVIPAGSLSNFITVTTIEDSLDEFDEIVDVSITAADFANVTAQDSASTTILDNDAIPTLSIAADAASFSESAPTASFTLTLSAPSGRDITVDYFASGTATGGADASVTTADYVTPSGQIVIPAGMSSIPLPIDLISDDRDEFDETLNVGLTFADFAGPGDPIVASTLLIDDDAEPTVALSIDNTSIAESGGAATITATLSAVSNKNVSVAIALGGNAIGSGTDYTSTPTTLTIPAGSTTAQLTITAVNDSLFEQPNEVVTATVSGITNAAWDNAPVATTILDDDVRTLTLTIAPGTVNELGGPGAATATVTRNTSTNGQLTVNLASSDPGEANVPLNVVIPIGQNAVTFPVDAFNDFLLDGTQTVTITASSPGYIDGVDTVDVTDSTVEVNLEASLFEVSEAGGPFVTITARTSNPAVGTQTVELDVSGLGLTASDYLLSSSTITIPTGATSGSVIFRVLDDSLVESDLEFATFTMQNPSAGLVFGGTTQQTVAIRDNDVAALSIDDVVSVEANSGSKTYTFTVSTTLESDRPYSVDFATLDGTATAVDGDYVTNSGTLNFSGIAGETRTIAVRVNGDRKVEADEAFTVRLSNIQSGSNAVTYAGGDTDGLGTITNNDSATISIDDVTLAEGDAGNTSFVFTVSLSGEVGTAISLTHDTADDTATTADGDYTPIVGGTTTFAANTGGPQTASIEVLVTGDTKTELNESFFVNLTNLLTSGLNVALADSQASGTITNDDAATISVSSESTLEGDAGSTLLTFTITLENDVDVPVTFGYSTANGTALTSDGDYTGAVGNALAFTGTAGETHTVAVNVLGDTKVERDETFELRLLNIAAANRDVTVAGPGVGTIQNDDTATISIADVSLNEGDLGATAVTFTVTLVGEVDNAVSIDYATAPGSASAADGDYVATSGTLTFPPNLGSPLTQTFSVLVTGDEKVELDESFLVNLSNIASGGRVINLIDGQAVASISNDDSASVSINDVAINEGDSGDTVFTFSVSLDAEVDADIAVNYASSDSNASVADGDYTGAFGNGLTFAANSGGPQTLTISAVVHGDEKVEVNERFLVNLAGLVNNGRNVTISDAEGIGTIINDDIATVTIDDVTQSEGDSGTSTFVFTITLDGEVDTNVGVTARTASSTASLTDPDYIANNGTNLVFPAGNGTSQTQSVAITVNGDEKVELDESFFVNLSGLSASGRAVTLSDARGIGRILNDDAATLAINDVTLAEGTGGNTDFIFTVTMSGEVDVPVQYGFVTADNTATAADGDYAPITAGSDSFVANNGPGPQTRTIRVQVAGDGKIEADESFLAVLSTVSAAGRDVSLLDAQGLGTILDDDSATISIDDVAINEGDSGTTDLVFTVTLSTEVSAPVSIEYGITDGTATVADGDYVGNSGGTLTFAANAGAGPQTQTFAIAVNGDEMVERHETIIANLTNLVANGLAITLTDAQATGTITNDEAATLSIDDVTAAEGNGGSTIFTFTVTLDADVDTGVDADYTTVASTAVVPDFASISGQLSFAGTAGETQTLSVSVQGDTTVELDESFFVNLSNIVAGGRDVTFLKGQGLGTITNDDAATIRITDSNVQEGNTGTVVTTLLVTLDGSVDTPVTLDYQTQDGTATLIGNDYLQANGSLTLSGTANQSLPIQVTVRGDFIVEQNENFFVDLLNLDASGRNVSISDSRGEATISNDDQVLVTISDATVVEQQAPNRSFLVFTVTRDNVTVPIDIDFVTVDGTATIADGDYLARNSTLSFPANSPRTANVVVEVVGDHRQEPDEILYVDISSSSFGVRIDDGRGVGTIVQDDGFITGQKWHDIDGDGVRDGNEPGLDGWVIQVLNDQGDVVTSAVTGSVDLNNDGSINPFTEQGLYEIPTGAGTWTITEVVQAGWRQTSPNAGNAVAYQLDQELNMRFTGSYFENWGGLGEKWIFSDEGWYFLDPTGDLFKWNGSPRENLSGEFVASLGAEFFATPSLLFNAPPPGNRTVTVVKDQTTSGIDFGNVPTGSIEGRKFHDVDANGKRGSSEPWLNGWLVTLRDSAGNIVATTTTADIDRNGNGSIDPRTERGFYRFENLVPGNYTVSEERRALWIQAGDGGIFAGSAFDLNQQRNFREAKFDFLNWGGRNEKWLWSDVGWHFITPDGSIYEWNGSPRTNLTGRLVTQLNSSYYQDLSLLYNAAQPNDYSVTVTGQEVTGLDFGNTFAHNGTGSGNVTVTVNGSAASITGDNLANTVVVFTASDGSVMATGAGGTTLNGSVGPVLLSSSGSLSSLNVSLNQGNDQLVLAGVSAGSLNVQTGAGLDVVATDGVSISGAATISNASGADEHRLHNSQFGSLDVNTGGLVSVQDSQVNGGLSVSGNNTPTTVFVQGASVGGATNVQTGSAADAIIANRSVFGGDLTVNSGGGNDLLSLRDSDVSGAVLVDGRGGNDQIGISNGSNVSGTATVRGGAGTDTFATDGTVSGSPSLNRIESTINSDLENLIDIALSNFSDLMLDN